MTLPSEDAAVEPPEPSAPGGLLAALLSAGSLVQPEPVLTRSLRFLLGLPGASKALDPLIERAGVKPPENGFWLTEVGHESGGRTDLEYWGRGDHSPTVVVEAKIGHLLEGSQLAGYQPRLDTANGLLVALVPSSRARTAQAVVDQLRQEFRAARHQARVDFWTWDQVVESLHEALLDNPDVLQLRGLIRATGALDVEPFTPSELLTPDDSRRDDLWRVLYRASSRVSSDRRPAQYGGLFTRWRFVSAGDYGAEFRIGLGRVGRLDHESWIWAAVDDSLRFAQVAQRSLIDHFPGALQEPWGVAVPIRLEPDLFGAELVDLVCEQLETIGKVIRNAIAIEIAEARTARLNRSVDVPESLIGIQLFTGQDLLDTSDRANDVLAILRAVAREIRGGRSSSFRPSEPFTQRVWIGVDPHATHISLGLGRTDPSTEPRPWAWLSVHEVTVDSDIAVSVLNRLYPNTATDIPFGRGVPLEIPAGATSSEAFYATLDQVNKVMTEIGEALSNQDSKLPAR